MSNSNECVVNLCGKSHRFVYLMCSELVSLSISLFKWPWNTFWIWGISWLKIIPLSFDVFDWSLFYSKFSEITVICERRKRYLEIKRPTKNAQSINHSALNPICLCIFFLYSHWYANLFNYWKSNIVVVQRTRRMTHPLVLNLVPYMENIRSHTSIIT